MKSLTNVWYEIDLIICFDYILMCRYHVQVLLTLVNSPFVFVVYAVYANESEPEAT